MHPTHLDLDRLHCAALCSEPKCLAGSHAGWTLSLLNVASRCDTVGNRQAYADANYHRSSHTMCKPGCGPENEAQDVPKAEHQVTNAPSSVFPAAAHLTLRFASKPVSSMAFIMSAHVVLPSLIDTTCVAAAYTFTRHTVCISTHDEWLYHDHAHDCAPSPGRCSPLRCCSSSATEALVDAGQLPAVAHVDGR